MKIDQAFQPINMNDIRFGEGLNGIRHQKSVSGASFSDYLSEQVSKVNDKMVGADQAVTDVVTGKSKNLHEMMVSLNQADLSLKMLTKVRNKALEAYQELMRMSV
jgi:flagellar hook-basal body complex protein FliE